ncbi:MAG TPA: His/Gly/Thr/Pro-type tRNA ligase C-terminal domain-containing protein, partial [Lachnospiraceae bacterium]|nr:His/Gly/Thr/Pro-type tRNA ligase C-terminal domain-containing protein [Lachnospiraceae bacterium]
ERFIGILIEHFAGKFPVWLAPIQVKILPISLPYLSYAKQVMEQLKEAGVRCEIDERDEKIGYKIREAQLDKVPYMVILGEKEMQSKQLAVRWRDSKETCVMNIEDCIAKVRASEKE